MSETLASDIGTAAGSSRSPTHSANTSGSSSGGGTAAGGLGRSESQDSNTSSSSTPAASTTGNASPRLPITSRIFGRTRSSSTKEDSDDQPDAAAAANHSESDKEKDKEKKKEKGSWQFFGPPKAKSGTGWLPFSFAMTHREKNQEIHKIFKQLPACEKLIDDYSCALQRDILIHGRLYLTQNWLCFYANIFSWETLLTIPLTTVTSITKERTALLIPNAILITTTVEKYGFSSLIQRDITYNIIFKVWQNSLLDQPIDPLELVKAARKTWGDSTDVGSHEDLWGPDVKNTTSTGRISRQHSMPTHVEIGQVSTTTTEGTSSTFVSTGRRSGHHRKAASESPALSRPATAETMATAAVTKPITAASVEPAVTTSKEDLVPSAAMSVISDNTQSSTETGSTEVAQNQQMVQPLTGTTTTDTKQETKKVKGVGDDKADSKFDSAASSGEFEAFSFPDDQGEVSCGCTEHNGRTIMNEVYNADVETVFQLLFTDSDFIRSFLKARKTTNLEIGEWTTQADSTRLRDVTYTLSLNYSFGPKYSPCTEHQVYSKIGQPGVRHVVSSDVINSNIPYGDTFYVSCVFCMTRVAHNRTRLRVTSNICFKKNCWGVVKNLIERNAGDGLRSYYNHLDSALKEYLVTLPAKRLKIRKTSRRRQHRRQSSPANKLGQVSSNRTFDEESITGVRKRRGSISSRHSLKSLDHKVSEEDATSSSSGERKTSRFRSMPKINLALSILLGLLVLSNVALYYQLTTYQSPSSPPLPSSPSLASSPTRQPQPTLLPSSSIQQWPSKQEDWIELVQSFWRQKDIEQQDLRQLLKEILDAMQQVEVSIHKTRKLLETHLQQLLGNTTQQTYYK